MLCESALCAPPTHTPDSRLLRAATRTRSSLHLPRESDTHAARPDDRVANCKGGDIIVEITSRRYSDSPMVLQGPGAGLKITAAGLFADLLRLSRSLVEFSMPIRR